MPIDDDNLNEFYKPIQNKLVSFFIENELIPTYEGKFVNPKNVIKANKKIRDVFNSEFLLNSKLVLSAFTFISASALSSKINAK